MERAPVEIKDSFSGNWEIFCEAVKNPKTIFVYDIDGILINSTKDVFEDFTRKTGVYAHPAELDRFNYLTYLARLANLPEGLVATAEDGWYDPKILRVSKKYFYIKPVVDKTLSFYGPDRNFVLTSRNPGLKDATLVSIREQFPEFNEGNILITKDDEADRAVFKARNLKVLAKNAPWVVFVDDSVDFVKAALGNGTQNCVVVNIPMGKITPDFEHERLMQIKRFPVVLQAMYPFMRAFDLALAQP